MLYIYITYKLVQYETGPSGPEHKPTSPGVVVGVSRAKKKKKKEIRAMPNTKIRTT